MDTQDGTAQSREQRLDEIIASYLNAQHSAEKPAPCEWIERYPEFASELKSFFQDQDHLVGAAHRPPHSSAPNRSQEGDEPSGKPAAQQNGTVQSTIRLVAGWPDLPTERYAINNFLARGGMGEIWLAEDKQLWRQVALKRLRQGRDEVRERFLAEAQITSQLEHPAIVPLHDLGRDKQGRPFYVMKYLEGPTLKDAILDYHADATDHQTSRELKQLRLLEVFIQICQAVAFAHNRGVIHRDLKPENVMLGQFGETVLLDWGLAKVKGMPESPGSPHVTVSLSGGSTQTQDGSVVGSPAYMSPEVAEGKIHEVDERTDVYLLGAILYEMLTGRPPRRGDSHLEMVELARTVEPTPPRKFDSTIPRTLEAVCCKAMARRMQDRYGSAGEVAEEIQCYLASEPVNAYREPVLRRALRWCKKHRRTVQCGAAAALAAIGALWAFSLMRENQRLQAVQQAQADVAELRRLADEARFYALSSDPPTERAPYYDLRKADAAASAALALADHWGENLAQLPLPSHRSDLQNELFDLILLTVQERLARNPASASADQLMALLDRAHYFGQPSKSYYRLLAECHDREGMAAEAKLARQRQQDPRTPRGAWDHFLLGEEYRTTALSPLNPDLDAPTRQRHAEALSRAVDEYRLALRLDPKSFWAYLQLGRCYLATGRDAEAVEALQTCIALRPESPWGYNARAAALIQLGRYAEAHEELNRLIKRHRGFLPARLNLGRALQLDDKLDDALEQYAAVLDAPPAQRLITAAYYRGEVYLQQQRLNLALQEFERVISSDPGFYPVYLTRAQVRLTRGEDDLALEDLDSYLFLVSDGRLEPESWQTHHARGRFLSRMLERIPPSVPQRRAALVQLMREDFEAAVQNGGRSAQLFDDLGRAYKYEKRYTEAVAAFTRGLELADPDSKLSIKLRLKRAWTLLNIDDTDSALVASALADFQHVVEHHPDVAEAHTGLGYVKALNRERDPAEQSAAEALLRVASVDLSAGTMQSDCLLLHNVACIYAKLSQSQPDREKQYQDLALAVLRQALRWWDHRAGALATAGDGPDLRQAIRYEQAFPPSLKARPEFQALLNPAP